MESDWLLHATDGALRSPAPTPLEEKSAAKSASKRSLIVQPPDMNGGGYLVNRLVTHNPAFDAIAADVPMANDAVFVGEAEAA